MSRRKDGRGHWPAGKSRQTDPVDASAFIAALQRELGLRPLARLAGVSSRSVSRWATGRTIEYDMLLTLIDRWWPPEVFRRQSRLHGDGDIGQGTWVAGVGQYTRESAGTLR